MHSIQAASTVTTEIEMADPTATSSSKDGNATASSSGGSYASASSGTAAGKATGGEDSNPPLTWELTKQKLVGSLRSWVMWLNTIAGMAIPALTYLHDNYADMRPFIPAKLYATGFVVMVLVNMALRFFKTNGPLEEK